MGGYQTVRLFRADIQIWLHTRVQIHDVANRRFSTINHKTVLFNGAFSETNPYPVELDFYLFSG